MESPIAPGGDHFTNLTYLNDSIIYWRNLLLSQDRFGNVLYEIIAPSLFGFVSISGVLGNSLVVYVICTRHRLRTDTNLLLLNLALADLSFVLICPPFTAYQFATLHWPFEGIVGDVLCKLMHYLLNVTACVTIYTLVLIAALRYATIVHSAGCSRYRSKVCVGLLILAVWALMLLINLPILFSYGVQMNPYGMPDCENFGRQFGQFIYAWFFAFAYVLPLCVICGFYIAIQRSFSSGIYMHGTQRAQQQKKYASQLICAVIITFAVCWFPVQIHLLLAYFGSVPDTDAYRTAAVLFNFLAYFNSCVNPVIYNFTSQDFRESFREVICDWRKCCCLWNSDAEQRGARGEDSNASQALVTFRRQSSELRNSGDHQTTARTSLRSNRLNILEGEGVEGDEFSNSTLHNNPSSTIGNNSPIGNNTGIETANKGTLTTPTSNRNGQNGFTNFSLDNDSKSKPKSNNSPSMNEIHITQSNDPSTSLLSSCTTNSPRDVSQSQPNGNCQQDTSCDMENDGHGNVEEEGDESGVYDEGEGFSIETYVSVGTQDMEQMSIGCNEEDILTSVTV